MRLLPLLLLLILLFNSCTDSSLPGETGTGTKDSVTSFVTEFSGGDQTDTSINGKLDLAHIPPYQNKAYVEINGNVPYFTEEEQTTKSYETYGKLDSLGRCGVAMACIGKDLMPMGPRGDISSVKPTGWKQNQYSFVSGGALYNRCHLIAFQLTGENANKENLITGTRYMNEAMIPFENMVADYIKETGNHVMYRVTPVFEGKNLLASGVLIEAMSVEDNGEGVSFCVWCYNVQPGVILDYRDGSNHAMDTAVTTAPIGADVTYILNTSSKKFHYPSCSSVPTISEKNKRNYTGTREELIADGYSPCGSCKP